MTHILINYILPTIIGVIAGWSVYEMGRLQGHETGVEEGFVLGRLSLLSNPLDNSGDQIAQLSHEAYEKAVDEYQKAVDEYQEGKSS